MKNYKILLPSLGKLMKRGIKPLHKLGLSIKTLRMSVKLSLKVWRIPTQTGKGAVVGSVFRAEVIAAFLSCLHLLANLTNRAN
jgi:hypothetical protein